MRRILPFLFLPVLLAACEGYKTPSIGNPERMSSGTLCYRYAYAKQTDALKDEIAARHLDCDEVLAGDHPYPGTPAMGER